MYKKWNKWICVIFAFLFTCCTPANMQTEKDAQWTDEQGLRYQKAEKADEYFIVGLTETYFEEIIVPSSFKEKPVTKIKEGAFYQKDKLKSVIISEGVSTIEKSAFSNSENLVKIELPNTIEQIGYSAFEGCVSLNYIESQGVYYLGNKQNAFLYLEKAEKDILSCNVEKGCRLVAAYAFMDCNELARVTLPNGVISIGRQAFDRCRALEKVLLPSSLKQIDSFAFAECETLVELNFEGDSSEWETIEKIWDWRYDCRLKRIVCLDKTVYIN